MSFQSTPVREVMNPATTTISADAPLFEAAERMFDEDRSCLVVVRDAPAQGWGILTQKDVLSVMAGRGRDPRRAARQRRDDPPQRDPAPPLRRGHRHPADAHAGRARARRWSRAPSWWGSSASRTCSATPWRPPAGPPDGRILGDSPADTTGVPHAPRPRRRRRRSPPPPGELERQARRPRQLLRHPRAAPHPRAHVPGARGRRPREPDPHRPRHRRQPAAGERAGRDERVPGGPPQRRPGADRGERGRQPDPGLQRARGRDRGRPHGIPQPDRRGVQRPRELRRGW